MAGRPRRGDAGGQLRRRPDILCRRPVEPGAGGGRRPAQRVRRGPGHLDDLLDAAHRGRPRRAPARRGAARRSRRRRGADPHRVPRGGPRGPGDHAVPVDGGPRVRADGRAVGRCRDRHRGRGRAVLAAVPPGGPDERRGVLQQDRDRADSDRRRGARLRARRPPGRRPAARSRLGRVRPDRAHRPRLLVGLDRHRHHRAVTEDDSAPGHRLARLPGCRHPAVRDRFSRGAGGV